MAKDKKDKKNGKKGKAGKLSFKARLFMIVLILLGVIFLPTSFLLVIGLLPSMLAAVLSVQRRGARASTVAAMNIAGCLPFVLKLWSGENTFEASVQIISNPNTLGVIYTAAAFGFLIDWVVTGLVAAFLYQKGAARMRQIKKRQEFLVSHWGEGVTGAKHADTEGAG